MGQTNSRRISHTLSDVPSTFRDDQLQQILNDIDEHISGKGYCEIGYIGNTPFISQVTVYKDNSKTLRRADTQLTYVDDNPPFIQSTITRIYDENDGNTIVAIITETINYNANKSVNFINTSIVRS